MLSATGAINEEFNAIPMTWAQVFTNAKNYVVRALNPILTKINSIANSERFKSFANGIAGAFTTIANIVAPVLDMIVNLGAFMYDNWSIILPILTAVLGPLLLYKAAMIAIAAWEAIVAVAKKVSAVASAIYTLALHKQRDKTIKATIAQYKLNAALLSCPLTWIIISIIVIIAILFAVVAIINKVTGAHISAVGVITGSLAAAGAFIANVFIGVAKIILGVVEGIVNQWVTCANFFGNLFNDPVASIIRLFEGMADAVLGIIEKIAAALDTVFGSNLSSAVSGWRDSLGSIADKAVSRFGNGTYQEKISKIDIDEIVKGFGFDTDFRLNYGNAYHTGYDWGAKKQEDMKKALEGLFETPDIPGGIDGSNLAGDTAKLKDEVSKVSSDLSVLRDLAEREAINQFTTASIVVDMNNTNYLSSEMDLDGMVNTLTKSVNESMAIAAEGVHI